MKQQKTASILYRAIAGLPVSRQIEVCHDACKRLGLKIAGEYNADDDEAALTEWRRGIKSTDIAMVAALACIPDWRAKKAKPGPVLSEVLLDFGSRVPPVLVMDVMSEVSSADRDRWLAHARTALDGLSLGSRKRPRRAYQKMAAKSHEPGVRRPSAAKQFAALPAETRLSIERIWRDPKLTAESAIAAMPEMVRRDIIRSTETAYRVLKERRPGDKRAGGRGRKVTRKKRKT